MKSVISLCNKCVKNHRYFLCELLDQKFTGQPEIGVHDHHGKGLQNSP